MIRTQTYSITNSLTLTNDLLVSYINLFWHETFESIKDSKHLYLLCKVQFTKEELGYRTLGHLRKVNFEDKELFIDYLSQRLTILNDSYLTHSISTITFSYVIKEGHCLDKERALLSDLSNKSLCTHTFNNMVLPITMNPSEYGTILLDNYVQTGGENIHRFIVEGSASKGPKPAPIMGDL